jgi:hypothetical protein
MFPKPKLSVKFPRSYDTRSYLLCEDGTIIATLNFKEGGVRGNVNDNELWEDIDLAPRLMILCKQNNYPYPKLFLHKAERLNYDSKFELKSLEVVDEESQYVISEDLLTIEYVGPLNVIPVVPDDLIVEFNQLEKNRKKVQGK